MQSIWSAVYWMWRVLNGNQSFNLSIDGDIDAADIAASTLTTDGSCTVGGSAGVGIDLNAGRDVNAGRDINAARNISAAGVLEGRLLYKPTVIATATAGMTASLSSGYNVFIYNAVDTGASVQILNAGSFEGDTIQFISPDPAETSSLVVKDPSGANLAAFQGGGGRTFIKAGGNWIRSNWGS